MKPLPDTPAGAWIAASTPAPADETPASLEATEPDEIYLVCATGYEECIPVGAYTDESAAHSEADRIRKIRNSRFDGDGAGVYRLQLNPDGPLGHWMVWLNEDGSWEETSFFCEYHDDYEIGSIEMECDLGEPRMWRGCGTTEEEAKQYAIDARNNALGEQYERI